MPSELERRLEGMLAAAPDPDAGAEEDALGRALSALPSAASGRRGLRVAAVALATVVVLLAIAAGSLAAAGALHVSFGPKARKSPAATQLLLPKGADGIATIVDGRLSVVTKGGFRLQGLPATAAALSPHALYVAACVDHSLVAMAPTGRLAWSHPAGGRVLAVAWAPDGLRIAYIVRVGRRLALHVIYGNGTHDTLIDRTVRVARPSWRADSLAVAYVGAGGRAIVYDLAHETRAVAASNPSVTHLAFGPVGKKLLLATPNAAILGGKEVAAGKVETIGWIHRHPAVALSSGTRSRIRSFGSGGRLLDDFVVPGAAVAITGGFVVVETSSTVPPGWASNEVLAGWGREKTVTTLLRVRPTTLEDLSIG